jgi:hypothetical protein
MAIAGSDKYCQELSSIILITTFARRLVTHQGRGVHVTGVSAAYTFKLNKNILSE